MKIYNLEKIVVSAMLFFSINYQSQIKDSLKPEEKKETIKYPQFQFKGLFQGRYMVATTKDVDVNELQHTDHTGTDNTFLIKYMRLQMQAKLSKRTELVVLANLADFKNDPKSKVLENAYLRYSFSPKFNVTVGQFRPWFGIEEQVPIDVLKTFDWSNQYTEFGKLGWTSFQIGVAAGGQMKLGNIPFQYAVSAVNGNGKNQINDNDNGKQYSTRLIFGLSKKYDINVGLNAGVGEVLSKKVYALGVDFTSLVRFNQQWSIDTQIEAKQATNHVLYYSLDPKIRTQNINDYLIRGIYILPNLRYELGLKNLNAFELSCRYEYLDSSFRINSNPRQTITPMLGAEILKNYGARLQVGMQIDRFKKQIPNSLQYNNNLFIIQVQSRF